MRIITYTTTDQDAGRAVRSVVPRRFCLGEHAFRRLKVQEAIRIGGEPVRADRILRAGEIIEIRLPSDEARPGSHTSLPSDVPASFIRYQDDDLLIVSKGAPLATLPSAHIRTSTLREQLAGMLGVAPDTFSYHPVNRLDKGTSGLLCVARHAHAQRLLSGQLHTGGFVREYLAVAEGVPKSESGTIDAPIARLGCGTRRGIRADGQHAVTHYRVEHTQNGRALIRLCLDTGRTHQIRVHLASIGCPIVGDYLYGKECPQLGGRFALHSAYLCCTQPITGGHIELNEPLPQALARLLAANHCQR
ncbi:MAG: RluA family pseudouridine synthase [Clostridia bacterium]|nr:RluA family pseudouridine synthase [Clostridia bacterium]